MPDTTQKRLMTGGRAWHEYRSEYRLQELKIVANWIVSGVSGAIVGLPGCGRSNFFGFISYRPDILNTYFIPESRKSILIPVDMRDLLETDLSMLYRLILRSFYQVCHAYDKTLQQEITAIYQQCLHEQDPFVAQSAVQEVLIGVESRQMRAILLLNHFDYFCQLATLQLVNVLRSLRDRFKDVLSFIVGMSQEAAYLPDHVVLGDMYELVDSHVCWVGAMCDADAQFLIEQSLRLSSISPDDEQLGAMIAMTGGFPSLLKAVCNWWMTLENAPPLAEWERILLQENSVQHRIKKIWLGLTQEEQLVLSKIQMEYNPAVESDSAEDRLKDTYYMAENTGYLDVLTKLSAKGVCTKSENGWRSRGTLLERYVATVENRGRGKIWLNSITGDIYQDQSPIQDLTFLEREVLSFLLKNPRVRHTKTDLIINTWPDELRQKGVSDNSLYQIILTIRKAIEPTPSEPRYLLTWRGKPEGGYQFYPEGKPL